jgi:putative membrane protein
MTLANIFNQSNDLTYGDYKLALLTNILIGLIALEHVGFLILEMFLWTKPIGMKIFNLDPEFAAKSASLAANQGLYNGFLAAGLFWSLMPSTASYSYYLKLFFLLCVLIAGLYGWYSVGKTILFIQASPALIALLLLIGANLTSGGQN